jgi:hypothetical protein
MPQHPGPGPGPQHPGYAPQRPGAAPQPGAPSRPGNPFGLVAIIAGGLLLLSTIVQVGVQTAAVARDDFEALGLSSGVSTLIDGLISLVAVVFGIIGLAQRGRPHALAGIGAGIGIATLVSAIVWGLIYPAALSLA